ncbi:MAG: radical SAM protein, partial [bacterium]|nr:radical SAM protein [bacterium]
MKILIINPPRVDGYPVVREERYEHKDMGSVYPPLNLLYTAAVLEKDGHDVSLIDANGFDIPFDELAGKMDEFRPGAVITRCGFDTQEQDVKVLEYAKRKFNARTIIRNKIISDVEGLKKSFLLKYRFIDIFINYETDLLISNVIKGLDRDWAAVRGISFLKGEEMVTTEGISIDAMNIDNQPFPAYHLLPNLKPYHTGVLDPPFALVITSRGCPFQCSFCAYAKMGCRIRKAENVLEELKYLRKKFGLKSFLFFDDLLGFNKKEFIRLMELMIREKLKLKWVSCTRANLITDEMLGLMKKAGCREMAIGIESGSEKILKSIRKGITLDDIRQAAKLLHKHRILFYGMAIIGLPGETRETIEETIRFIREVDPFYTQFCFATPFPNTGIY